MLVSFQTRSPALWQRWVRSGSIRTDQPGTLPGTGAKGWHGVLAEDGSTEQSRSAGVLQLMGESAAKLAGFSEYFLSSGFGKGEHHLRFRPSRLRDSYLDALHWTQTVTSGLMI